MGTTPPPIAVSASLTPLLCMGEVMAELSTVFPLQHTQYFEKQFAGDAFNTAMAAQRMGTPTGFLTRLGADPLSVAVKQRMIEAGLHSQWLKDGPGQLGLYLLSRRYPHPWKAQYYRQGSAASGLHPDDLTRWQWEACGVRLLYLTGITLALSHSARLLALKALNLAEKTAHCLSAFDLNYRDVLWPNRMLLTETLDRVLPQLDILTTGWSDLHAVFAFESVPQAQTYLHSKGIPWVIIRQANGCQLSHYSGARAEILHPVQTETGAVVGAGDAFNAGLFHHLLQGAGLQQAAQFACQLAQDCISRGNGTVWSPQP
jgi:2-dehydro-3-deoxygluconokinase